MEDSSLLHQVLVTIELKIKDLVLHCVTMKKLCHFLCELYEGSINIKRAYDVIQELFRKKQKGKPMDDHYDELNRLA